MPTPVLQTRDIVKRFPGVVALKGVSFDLRPGEVHALCGENGAGKSTLIKVLSGVHPHGSYEGEVCRDGVPVAFRSVRDAERAGIAVIHQELALISEMTVAENLSFGLRVRGVARDEIAARVQRTAELLQLGKSPAFEVAGTAAAVA